MGLSGTMTPDSLSRESSPTPEAMGLGAEPTLEHLPPPQPVSQKFANLSHDIKFSQSAPGSPQGVYLGVFVLGYQLF